MTRPLCVMMVAAEASGDALGAGLARALGQRLGEGVRFVGVGGAEMAAAGVQSPFDISDLSVLGFWEGLRALPRVLRRVRDTVALARRERPDVAVLIDSWGFTLRVAQGLKTVMPEVPRVKYVGPQVWASRPGRSRTLARAVDLLLSIHAFDAPHFERDGLETVFVGNRTLSLDFSGGDAARLRREIGAEADAPLLVVLPGSRPAEVERLLPPFRAAAERLARDLPQLRVVIPMAPTVAAQVRRLTADWAMAPMLIEGEARKRDAFAAANAALVCSGTATTELALAGVPMVVAYRVSWLTYQIGKRLIRTRYITLLNIAADRAVAPEFIQHECNGPVLASALLQLVEDPARAARQVAAQNAALALMGRSTGDPSERAADAVLALLRSRGRLV